MTRPSAVECLYIITANGKRLKGMHTCSESPARPLLAGPIRGGTTARYALISNTPRVEDSAGSHSPLLAGFNRDARCKPTPSFLALKYQNSANKKKKTNKPVTSCAFVFILQRRKPMQDKFCQENTVEDGDGKISSSEEKRINNMTSNRTLLPTSCCKQVQHKVKVLLTVNKNSQ
jgi:hypothetical protein